jgi:hypothetical protein
MLWTLLPAFAADVTCKDDTAYSRYADGTRVALPGVPCERAAEATFLDDGRPRVVVPPRGELHGVVYRFDRYKERTLIPATTQEFHTPANLERALAGAPFAVDEVGTSPVITADARVRLEVDRPATWFCGSRSWTVETTSSQTFPQDTLPMSCRVRSDGRVASFEVVVSGTIWCATVGGKYGCARVMR